MSRIRFHGPPFLSFSSFLALIGIALTTYARRLIGQKLEPSWDVNTEIGIRFWRRQFTLAMTSPDIAAGRRILDCLQTESPDVYDVNCRIETKPDGTWHMPGHRTSNAAVLYFHGGGYSFHGAMNRRFASMLAHHIGAPVFAPEYRLTPEHPHPAQAEDAMTAWRFMTAKTDPQQIVVIGDSAGGHMALMLLQDLRRAGLKQPALVIGLCPWTDIGDRGASLHDNDRYDLVQGWMALQFGKWLDPDGHFGGELLSPTAHDFSRLAPIYLQAGGREILRDMICDFAKKQADAKADIMLDIWPTMPHDFQLFDSTRHEARAALTRIVKAVRQVVDRDAGLQSGEMTKLVSGSIWNT